MHIPTLRQLQYLKLLAEHGSFSRAADAAHVTQPTLSAGVAELEKILGAAGIDPADVRSAKVGGREVSMNRDSRPKTWKDIWGAGQGVGAIDAVLPVRELVDRMIVEYRDAKARLDTM